MATTVLPQLQEIESELAAQEESLTAQLQEVKDKLNGIRAVLPMFDENGESLSASSAQGSAEKSAADSGTPTQEKKADSGKSAATKSTKTTRKKSKKKDGRAADWQKYTRPGVKNQSIPEAVKLILSTQPDKEFKIAEVMESLFKDMPKNQYLKARNRVSNVLSGGVRAGDWYRGERSTYRMNAS